MKLLDAFLALLLPAVVLLHLAVAPYTKVEESFNIQAAHDVLVYGTPLGAGAGTRLAERYDHFSFPGAVPRTFVGAVVLAGLGQPAIAALDMLGTSFTALNASTTASGSVVQRQVASGVDGPTAQLLLRALLGLANSGALLALARTLAAVGGRGAARWYILLQASQFHVVFYASRTLPNMFAFFLTTLAFAFLLSSLHRLRLVSSPSSPSSPSSSSLSSNPPKSFAAYPSSNGGRVRVALGLLVFAGVVFRAEVALLLAAVAAYLVVVPLASVEHILRTCAVSVAVALALSLPIDAYFWQRFPASLPFFWPELHSFVFNVLHGQASQWGILPWHYYLTSAVPRLLLNPLVPVVLVPLALTRPATRTLAGLLVWPSLLFVALYSLQPHKEARFVLYVVPPLTAAGALGADQVTKANGKGLLWRATAAALAFSVLLTFAASTAMLGISALNYPGGEALAALRQLVRADPGAASVVAAHADVRACMTGVTLFGSTLGPALPSHQQAVERRRAAMASTALGGIGFNIATGSMGPADTGADAVHAIMTTTGPQLVVDKTEDKQLLQDPEFWAQFDYVLTENPQTVVVGHDGANDDKWATIAVAEGYAGFEMLRPGQAVRQGIDKDERESSEEDVTVVGYGVLLDRARQSIRGLTGGWWFGPRIAPQIYILRRVKDRVRTEQHAKVS
ncbi:alpha-1,6-mannosyltransferase subunit [Niveomyces insectorum RCEF 264]|uniref:Mannosyltransferase n=1 Tax=Niveomyces insectorum RCEF 264 TaxID=1081102 RepID=A0A167M5G4_9HYPO|nr:alpha-1,6-mannosyltransferase subunit [Niveomyces insectorum RCEF 264]